MFYRNADQLERIQKNIKEVYESNRWSNGKFTEMFGELAKEKFLKNVPKMQVLPTANGTVALQIAIAALPKDGTLLLPELTATPVWFGTAEAKQVEYYSVEDRWNPDLNKIADICRNDSARGKTAIVVFVHTGGIVSDNIRELRNICTDYDAILIEDISHAQGCVSGEGTKAGYYGDIVVGSMYATKALNSGEGGFISYNEDLIELYPFWNSGRGSDESQVLPGSMGLNGRVSEFQAAIMCEVVRDFDKIMNSRTQLAHEYDDLIFPKIVPIKDTKAVSSYYKYILYVSEGESNKIVELQTKLPKGSLTGLVHHVYYTGTNNLYGSESLSYRHLCLNLFAENKVEIANIINEVFK